jgi:hypothetical protein
MKGYSRWKKAKSKPVPFENQTPRVRHPNLSYRFMSWPPAHTEQVYANGFLGNAAKECYPLLVTD